MIYTDILFIRDNYAIQRDNMTLLVVTAEQYYNGRTYANYSTLGILCTESRNIRCNLLTCFQCIMLLDLLAVTHRCIHPPLISLLCSVQAQGPQESHSYYWLFHVKGTTGYYRSLQVTTGYFMFLNGTTGCYMFLETNIGYYPGSFYNHLSGILLRRITCFFFKICNNIFL